MPKIIETTVYTFDELNDAAKENARQWFREADFFDSEEISENFATELAELGYPTDDIRFSLGYSQGDGMAFYGGIEHGPKTLDSLIKRLIPKSSDRRILRRNRKDSYGEYTILDNLYIKIECMNSHYNHYNSMCVDWDYEGNEDLLTPAANRVINDFIGSLKMDIKAVSMKLERSGYEIIEWRDSDEVIDESIIANEYTFTESGERF